MTDEGDRDGRGARRSALLGAALLLPILATVVVGAGAARPPATSDGVWTTPLQVVLGLAGLGALIALVLVLRETEIDGVRPQPSRGHARSLVLFALLVVAIIALPQLDLEPLAADVSPFSFGPSRGGAPTAEPLPVSPTAVVAGLAALALAVVGGVLLLRGGSGRATLQQAPDDPDGRAARGPVDVSPQGPPAQVVLTAYAAAREEVVRRLDAGEHDPPARLLRRAATTAMAAPLQVLTALYLPVRYGRGTATAADAATAVAALEDLRAPAAGGGS